MTALVPLMQTCRGKRWVALLPAGGPPRVEVYVGATACGVLAPRPDLLAGQVAWGDGVPLHFAWGARGPGSLFRPGALLLAASILADAFGNEPERATRLIRPMVEDLLSLYLPTAPWALTYSKLCLMIARWEDLLDEAEDMR